MSTQRIVQGVALLVLAVAGAVIGWVAWHVQGNVWLAAGIGCSIVAEGAALVAAGEWLTRRRERLRQRLAAERPGPGVCDPGWVPPGWFLPAYDPRRHDQPPR